MYTVRQLEPTVLSPMQAAIFHPPVSARRFMNSAFGLSLLAHMFVLFFVFPSFTPPKLTPVITTYQVDLVSHDIGYQEAPVDELLPPAEPEQKKVTEKLGAAPPPPKSAPKPEPLTQEKIVEPTPQQESVVSVETQQPASLSEPLKNNATSTPEEVVENVEAVPSEPVEKIAEKPVEDEPKVEPQPEIKPSLPVYEVGSKNNPKPPYPTVATRKGWQGSVVLGVSVNADGSINKVIIIKSSEYAVFNFAAWETVKKEWVFEPAMLKGKPVDSYIEVPIVFELE